MEENRPTIPPLQPNNRDEDWLEQTRRYGMRPSDFVGAVDMRSLAADVARIAALEAELAQARTELERLRQPYSRLAYYEWSALEDKQDYRSLAYAFESDSRAMHDENEALRAQLAQTWQPVEDGTYPIGTGEIEVAGETLGIFGADEVGEDAYALLALEDEYRLCRRTPAEVQPWPSGPHHQED